MSANGMQFDHSLRAQLVRTLAALAGLSLAAAQLAACTPTSSTTSRSTAILGSAESFAVLGASTVTNTGPTTIIGDLGLSPGLAVIGFPPGLVTGGTIHAGDAMALQAQDDVTTAYNSLAAQPCDHDLTDQDLGGLTLTPGVYCFSSSAQLTGTVTLDGLGSLDSVFVFQIGSALTTASDSRVLVINQAQGCNVFFQIGSSATLGTTTAFVGSIVALTSITLNTGAQVAGRVLARTGAVTMDSNHVEVATCLHSGEVPDAGHSGCTLCGEHLVDLQTDHANCGTCGNYCSWDSMCVDGVCSCSDTVCDDICVNLDVNPVNCGACGNVCGADQWCNNGACTTVCAGTVCDGWCADLTSNPDACGSCDNQCGANESCNGGVCACAGTMCDAACVDLSSSSTDCGVCGNACAASECCTDGACVAL